MRSVFNFSVASLLLISSSGCCFYHQESVDDLNSIKLKVPPLYDAFATPPTVEEPAQVSDIRGLFTRTEEREHSIWPWCKPTEIAVHAAQDTFEGQVADRNKKLPATMPAAAVKIYKDQIDKQVGEAIEAVETRKH